MMPKCRYAGVISFNADAQLCGCPIMVIMYVVPLPCIGCHVITVYLYAMTVEI
jgi:hypothetical protein